MVPSAAPLGDRTRWPLAVACILVAAAVFTTSPGSVRVMVRVGAGVRLRVQVRGQRQAKARVHTMVFNLEVMMICLIRVDSGYNHVTAYDLF